MNIALKCYPRVVGSFLHSNGVDRRVRGVPGHVEGGCPNRFPLAWIGALHRRYGWAVSKTMGS